MLWYYDIRNNYNYLVAAVTRLCRKVPEFKAGPEFEKFFEDFLDYYDIKGPIPLIPFEEYINNHPSYTAAKKRSLIKLHHETKNLSLEELWRYTTAASFVKWEPYMEEKKPRLINPRDDVYKVRVAHIHASVDKFIYEKLKDFLVKGMTSPERSAKIDEVFGDRDETLSSDFSSQEVSIKEFLMRLECRIYERLLTGVITTEELNLIIVTKLSPQRLEGSGLKLVLDVARDSGDPDTASMNAVENVVSTSFSYKEQLYPELTNQEFFALKGDDYDILCEGDDGLHSSKRGRKYRDWETVSPVTIPVSQSRYLFPSHDIPRKTLIERSITFARISTPIRKIVFMILPQPQRSEIAIRHWWNKWITIYSYYTTLINRCKIIM